MIWATTLAAVGFGLNRAQATASHGLPRDTRIEWVNRPAWLESGEWGAILSDLESSLQIYPDTDLFDRNVCAYVGEHLANSPWIERVERISKCNDGRIRVQAAFRRPFALVECGPTAYLIDETAVRLPWQLAASAVRHEDWLTIRGVREQAPPIGQHWDGGDLTAGIKFLKWLSRRLDPANPPEIRAYLRSISVANYGRRKSLWLGELLLTTINPKVYVDWGAPPQEEYPVEASAEHKLSGLLRPEVVQWLREGRSIEVRWGEIKPVATRPEYSAE
ncbi:MAG: hypothetical protein HZB38_17305 [Planctomycetes bacterium]|nr:hypothetical protein [Planctomycetota bacterium]